MLLPSLFSGLRYLFAGVFCVVVHHCWWGLFLWYLLFSRLLGGLNIGASIVFRIVESILIIRGEKELFHCFHLCVYILLNNLSPNKYTFDADQMEKSLHQHLYQIQKQKKQYEVYFFHEWSSLNYSYKFLHFNFAPLI